MSGKSSWRADSFQEQAESSGALASDSRQSYALSIRLPHPFPAMDWIANLGLDRASCRHAYPDRRIRRNALAGIEYRRNNAVIVATATGRT
jgi:hypothetical protein